MKVLFVSSGNAKTNNRISSLIYNQGESLLQAGIDLEFFPIIGKGIKGYLKNIPKLNSFLRKNKFDVIHAHYSKSAYVAALANIGFRNPIVTSLMGSDIQVKSIEKQVIHFFSNFLWKATIVKSNRMRDGIEIPSADVVPNGVNFNRFTPINKSEAIQKVGFESDKINIIFVADPTRYSKNFELAEAVVKKLNNDKIRLHKIFNIKHEEISNFMYAADLLLLTSRWEGSPNVIKEAMVCNLPIVSTDVGDVRELIGKTPGCYICNQDVDVIADNVKNACDFKGRTQGREDVKRLDDGQIAARLIKIYKSVMR